MLEKEFIERLIGSGIETRRHDATSFVTALLPR